MLTAQEAGPPQTTPPQISETCPTEAAPAGAADGSSMRQVPASFMAGRALNRPTPIYPKAAKIKHIGGVVMMHAIIGKDGTMERVDALCGPALLVPAAVEAAWKWTYKPSDDIDGKPLEVETTITMNFSFGPAAAPPTGSSSRINDVEVVDIPEGSPELDGVKKDKLRWPKGARKDGVSGVVKLVVLIGIDGRVESAKAVSGPEVLQPAAEETVKKYRYPKYAVGGVPKMVRTTATVIYGASS